MPAGSVNSNYRLMLDGQDAAVSPASTRSRIAPGPKGRPGFSTTSPASGVADAAAAAARRTARVHGGSSTRERAPARGRALSLARRRDPLPGARHARASPHGGRKLAEVHRAGATFAERAPGRFRIDDLRVRLERIAAAEERRASGDGPARSRSASTAPSEPETPICRTASFTAICFATTCSGKTATRWPCSTSRARATAPGRTISW